MAQFIRLMCGYPGVWGVGRRPSLTRSPHHLPLLAGPQATAGALIGGLERAGGGTVVLAFGPGFAFKGDTFRSLQNGPGCLEGRRPRLR